MPPAPQPTSKPGRFPPILIGAGALVVALGFGLPVLTSNTAPEKSAPAAKGKATEEPPANSPTPVVPPSATGLGASLARLAVGLAVACGACVLAARWFGQKPAATPGTMEVLASIPVARCAVHLVRAGDRRLLIGTDLGGVKALLELPGPEPALLPPPEVAAAPPVAAPAPPAAPPPSREEVVALLAKLLSRPGAPPPT
jgi:hypothetical protein